MLVHPQFDPVAVSVGPLAVRWYGLMYLIGFALVWAAGRYRIARTPGAVWTAKDLDDALFYGILGTIIGGRLGYVLFYKLADYATEPAQLLRDRQPEQLVAPEQRDDIDGVLVAPVDLRGARRDALLAQPPDRAGQRLLLGSQRKRHSDHLHLSLFPRHDSTIAPHGQRGIRDFSCFVEVVDLSLPLACHPEARSAEESPERIR